MIRTKGACAASSVLTRPALEMSVDRLCGWAGRHSRYDLRVEPDGGLIGVRALLPQLGDILCIANARSDSYDDIWFTHEYREAPDNALKFAEESFPMMIAEGAFPSMRFEVAESAREYDWRLRSDLSLMYGAFNASIRDGHSGFSCVLSVGAISPAHADTAYRRDLFSRCLTTMGLEDHVMFVDKDDGVQVEVRPPFAQDPPYPKGGNPLKDTLFIHNFSSIESARNAVIRVVDSMRDRVVLSEISIFSKLDAYERIRPNLNASCPWWWFSVIGGLRHGVWPGALNSQTGPRWIPLISWTRRRTVEGIFLDSHFLCSAIRSDEGWRLEVCSDTNDPHRLLREATEGTGLDFELIEDPNHPLATIE